MIGRGRDRYMISDAEIRGLVLATLYNLRDSNGGVVPLSDINFSPHPITSQKIDAVSQHLADLELIQWIPTPAGTETPIAGKGRIMGKGAAAFEAGRCDEINIRFPDMPVGVAKEAGSNQRAGTSSKSAQGKTQRAGEAASTDNSSQVSAEVGRADYVEAHVHGHGHRSD